MMSARPLPAVCLKTPLIDHPLDLNFCKKKSIILPFLFSHVYHHDFIIHTYFAYNGILIVKNKFKW